MDESTPPPQPRPLPVVPVRRSGSTVAQRAGFLLAGLALGAAIVLATMSLMPKEQRVVYRDRPVLSQGTAPESQTPIAGVPVPGKMGAPAKPTPTSTDAKMAPSPDVKKSPSGKVGPYNPFAGTKPPREISGHIDPGVPLLPSITPTGDTPPAADSPAPRGLLLTVRMDVSDPDSAVRGLQALASKQGGSAIQFDESAAKQDAEGAVLFVPVTKAIETQKQLASVGNVVVSDSWNGPASDRLDKIESAAEAKLRDLRIQRQELLVRYLEDAPQIKHIDEDTDRIKKCLAQLRSHGAGPTTAVIKIKFLG